MYTNTKYWPIGGSCVEIRIFSAMNFYHATLGGAQMWPISNCTECLSIERDVRDCLLTSLADKGQRLYLLLD